MVRYTFEVVADVGKGGHVHGEIGVMLSSAEVNAIIDYMKENGDFIDYDDLRQRSPELYDKIENAAWKELPNMLSSFYFTMDSLECYWCEFPAELKDIAETELGHPLYRPKSTRTIEEDALEDKEKEEIEQWIRNNTEEVLDFMESEYQDRRDKYLAENLDEDNSLNDKPIEDDTQTEDPFPVEIYDVALEMEDYEDKLVDITYTSYSRFSDNEHERHYIGQIGHCGEWTLELAYPIDPTTRECNSVSNYCYVHDIKIAPVNDSDVVDWLREAHRVCEDARQLIKDTWVVEHSKATQDEREEVFRYIDADYDLNNAKIDAVIPYKGCKEHFLRL